MMNHSTRTVATSDAQHGFVPRRSCLTNILTKQCVTELIDDGETAWPFLFAVKLDFEILLWSIPFWIILIYSRKAYMQHTYLLKDGHSNTWWILPLEDRNSRRQHIRSSFWMTLNHCAVFLVLDMFTVKLIICILWSFAIIIHVFYDILHMLSPALFHIKIPEDQFKKPCFQ